MVARARSAEVTAERILDATVEVFLEDPSDRFSLEDIARRAGVTVQTVIRRFGGREGVLEAAARHEQQRVQDERELAQPGNLSDAVRVLVSHYERTGDQVLRLLGEEGRVRALGPMLERGRQMHRRWCEQAFASALDGLAGVARERRLAQLVAVCDVYTWKLLRRQAGLSRRQTELALIELLSPLVEGGS